MTLNSQEISELLPHRYPFLLVDRVLELVPGKSCRAVKNVTVNEPFFPGHFPGQPTMPGVLILEAMAQTGALMVLIMDEYRGKLPYLVGTDKVKYRKPVVPGDVLEMEVISIWHRRGYGRISATAMVDGEVAASAEITYYLK